MSADDLIKRARELDKAATQGPWVTPNYPDVVESTSEHVIAEVCTGNYEDDARFIAESRTLLPQLADALESAQKERAQWEIQAQDLRDRVVQLEAYVAQARPIVEAVRRWQDLPMSGEDSAIVVQLLDDVALPKEQP